MAIPKIALISGSIRKDSMNKKLVDAMAKEFKARGAKPVKIDLASYEMPIYNGDYEAEFGVPKTAKNLVRRLKSCGGVFVATPEYNGCLPALLKNTIDWTTRIEMGQFTGPVYGIGAASPGPMSGIMAMRQLHFILTRLGARVVTSGLGVGFSGKAFGPRGTFTDDRVQARARALAASMIAAIDERH